MGSTPAAGATEEGPARAGMTKSWVYFLSPDSSRGGSRPPSMPTPPPEVAEEVDGDDGAERCLFLEPLPSSPSSEEVGEAGEGGEEGVERDGWGAGEYDSSWSMSVNAAAPRPALAISLMRR